MPKAICVVRMKQTGTDRGAPDVPVNVNFVHCGVDLPGNYQAYVVTASGAVLTQLSNHANFVAGQVIQRSGEIWAWEDSRTAIAAGTLVKVNTWLVANGHAPMTAQNSILDLLRVFAPDYAPGQDDVFGD